MMTAVVAGALLAVTVSASQQQSYPRQRPGYGTPRSTQGEQTRATGAGYGDYLRLGQRRLPGIGGGLPIVPLPTGMRGLIPFFPGALPRAAKDGAQDPKGDLSGWPSWVQLGGPGKRVVDRERSRGRPSPQQCYLARFAEVVRVRPADEVAFYPLHFWDKSRLLDAGSEVRIDGQGRSLLVFADGTQVDLLGEAHVIFSQGTKQTLRLAMPWVTRADCRLGTRAVEIVLPDGSLCRGSQTHLLIQRETRTAGWARSGVEDRIVVRNWGPGEMRLQPTGAVAANVADGIVLAPNRRLLIPIVRDQDRTAGEPDVGSMSLRLGGGGVAVRASISATLDKMGEALRVRCPGDRATLVWGGAQFQLPAGHEVTIHPIGGSPFGRWATLRPLKAPTGERAAEPREGAGGGDQPEKGESEPPK
jgi:hypothetical protein